MNTLDRLKRELLMFIERALIGERFRRLYPGRVVGQSGNTVDVVLDDATMVVPPAPLRHGLPGWHVEVPSGARVMVGFDGGDPSKPFAALWEPGDAMLNRFNGGTHRVGRVGDATDDGTWTWAAVTNPATSPPTTDLYITHRRPGATEVTGVKVAGLPAGVTVSAVSTPTPGTDFAQRGRIDEGAEGLEA